MEIRLLGYMGGPREIVSNPRSKVYVYVLYFLVERVWHRGQVQYIVSSSDKWVVRENNSDPLV